jgi:hypothetical protein
MCWNADISINTFLFGIFAIVFIFLANTYTKYKQDTFKNPLIYLLLLEIAIMQLIEFFLWKNLKNEKINKLLTSFASYVVTCQPLTIILMISNKYILIPILLCYLLFLFIQRMFLYNPVLTTIKNGHLSWGWINIKDKISIFIFLSFYIFSSYFVNHLLFLFTLITLLISLFFYFKDNTFGSMWCWSFNIFFLYCIIDILIIKPFKEYNNVC